MKTFCLITTVALLAGFQISSAQLVNQYIVKEAYELLRTDLRADIPQMRDHIGGLDPSYEGEHAWQKAYITTGAWREDREDVVFGYRLSNLLNNYSLVSISHFWDADQGDLTQNVFRVSPIPHVAFSIGPYENSYDKLRQFANGGWVLWFPDTIIARRVSNDHYLALMPIPVPDPAPSGVPMEYSSLAGFYQSQILKLRTDQAISCIMLDLNDQTVITPDTPSFDIRVETDVRDRIVWETLGRMCHLLGDLSFPTHSRRDEHGLDPDSYEDWVSVEGGPYLSWTHDSVGPYINPYNADNDPLHYLMYTMQQQSNHFGSNGPYESMGNDSIGGSPRPLEKAYLAALDLPSFGAPGGPGPWTEANLRNIMNHTLPYAIRATGGMLYWFAREAGLIPSLSVDGEREAVPASFRLDQNYPNPFNPGTTITYELPKQGHVTLKIYDVLGHEVATLVDEVESPGFKSVKFDATSLRKPLASGVYFYRLEAGQLSATRRLMLVK